MSYYLPSDNEIVKLIIDYELDTNLSITSAISEGLYKLITEVESATKIANLNPKRNHEYIRYLIYFRRYVQVSYSNANSSLRLKLENYYKLKKLHKLL